MDGRMLDLGVVGPPLGLGSVAPPLERRLSFRRAEFGHSMSNDMGADRGSLKMGALQPGSSDWWRGWLVSVQRHF